MLYKPHVDPAAPPLQDTLLPLGPVDLQQLQAMVAQQGQAIAAYQEQLTPLQATDVQLLHWALSALLPHRQSLASSWQVATLYR